MWEVTEMKVVVGKGEGVGEGAGGRRLKQEN
jgi:hypothetical protein